MKKRWWIVIGIVVVIILLLLRIGIIMKCSQSISYATTKIDDKVKNDISRLFSDENKKLIIYPPSKIIEFEKGSKGSGFAFSIRNFYNNDAEYYYNIEVDPNFQIETKCNGLYKKEANNWIDESQGVVKIPRNSIIEEPVLVTFTVPNNAPACTIPYVIEIKYRITNSTGIYVLDGAHIVIINKKTFLNKIELLVQGIIKGITNGFLSC
jgi:hypothetical protein